MIHTLRYYPPHRTRPIPADPEAHLCFWFQRWLGRPLIPVEQRTIIPMERRRRLGLACRFFIDDTGRYGTIIRDILLNYVRYLSETILRGRDTFIIARTKREARLLATPAFGPRLHRNPRVHPRSQYARHLRESRSDLGAYTVICPETDIARRELRSLEAIVASIENLDATDPADHHYRPPRPGPRILILAPRANAPDPDATASPPPAIKIPV